MDASIARKVVKSRRVTGWCRKGILVVIREDWVNVDIGREGEWGEGEDR